MTTQRTDQPSNVSTEETPRAPDEHIVTSDVGFVPELPPGPREDDQSESAAGDKPAQSKPDSETGTAPEKPPAKKSKRNRSSERRIHTLSVKLSEAEAREAENAREIAELKETVSTLGKATPKSKEPMIQDFATPREYAKAYTKWESAQSDESPPPRKRPTPPKPVHDDKPPTATEDPEIIGFRERGKAKLGDDFMEALEVPGTAVNQVMGEFMIDSDVGPELYIHLADNQEDAKKIYDMPAHKAIATLQRLATKARKNELIDAEGTLDVSDGGDVTAANTGKTERIQTQIGTKAPEPPDTSIKGDADLKANPERESMDEYAARRRKEEARKRGYPI